MTKDELRALSKPAYKKLVAKITHQKEAIERIRRMQESSRLQAYGDMLAIQDVRAQCDKWAAAPYLRHVSDKEQVRLLAMCRLGLLPVEEETGRWQHLPRAERTCACGMELGSVRHFMSACTMENLGAVDSTSWIELMGAAWYCTATVPGQRWRQIARYVQRRWHVKRGPVDRRRDDEAESNDDAAEDSESATVSDTESSSSDAATSDAVEPDDEEDEPERARRTRE
jgi:hypothetical protein